MPQSSSKQRVCYQMNIYDNEHCGDHLDIMSNFDLSTPDDQDKTRKDLHTFCWLYRENDAWLAAAGADGLIHIVSLANSQEIDILAGHTSKIYDCICLWIHEHLKFGSCWFLESINDLQTHPFSDNYILSTSRDGTIRLWDVDARKCLVIFEADATVTVSLSDVAAFPPGPLYPCQVWPNMLNSAFTLMGKNSSRVTPVESFENGKFLPLMLRRGWMNPLQ